MPLLFKNTRLSSETKKTRFPKNEELLLHESTGKLMSTAIPVTFQDFSLLRTETLLRNAPNIKNTDTIYVVDKKGRLVGELLIGEMFKHSKSAIIKDVMRVDTVSVRDTADQEEAALLAVKHGRGSLPVVDKKRRLVGAITSSSIFDILNKEHVEDFLHSVGVGKFHNPTSDLLHIPAGPYFLKRLPSLVIGLVGGVLAAFIVSFFEETLSELFLLAAFIPAVVYIADAVSSQSEMIFIRSLTVFSSFDIKKYIFREAKVVFYIALTLSSLMFIFSFLVWGSSVLSWILGISFFTTIIFSAIIGVALPFLLNKFNLDPVIASGPFSTVIVDILSVMIYLFLSFVVLFLFA